METSTIIPQKERSSISNFLSFETSALGIENTLADSNPTNNYNWQSLTTSNYSFMPAYNSRISFYKSPSHHNSVESSYDNEQAVGLPAANMDDSHLHHPYTRIMA